jgi:hypothetical protein
MLDILKALAHGVGDMTYGDPDDADAVKAADVVRWAVEEIDRLREERRWVPVGERLPDDEEWVDIAGDWGDFVGWYDSKWHNLFDDDPGGEVTHWKKRPPGPEGDGNG